MKTSKPYLPAAAVLCAVTFAATLIWRVALPMGHNRRIAAIEQEIRNVPIYRTEAYIQDAIGRVEGMDDRLSQERRDFTATRDKLNLALAVSGIAALALAIPAFSKPRNHPAATPTAPGHGTHPG